MAERLRPLNWLGGPIWFQASGLLAGSGSGTLRSNATQRNAELELAPPRSFGFLDL